jgi:long-subunit acyl-CoA synthetase (AMP-forming)
VQSSGTAEDLERVRQLRPQLQPEDAINIQFTSGTTGMPKARRCLITTSSTTATSSRSA